MMEGPMLQTILGPVKLKIHRETSKDLFMKLAWAKALQS